MKYVLTLAALLSVALTASLHAQSTAFTYHGQLTESGSPVDGLYDVTLTIYDAPTNGTSLGVDANAATPVENGLFTLTVDFGGGVFDGSDRWLEVGAATNGGVSQILTPRQPIHSVPYAIRAANFDGAVSAGQITGTLSPGNIGVGTITSAMLADGSVTSNHLTVGSVTTTSLADGAVTSSKVFQVDRTFPLTTFVNPDPDGADGFGGAVAGVGADRVVVGAASEDASFFLGVGAAYVYDTSGTLLTTITNPVPGIGELFGQSVAALGADRVLIGASQDNLGGADAGAAFLYGIDGTLLTTFTNPAPAVLDRFGIAIASLGDDQVLIGADQDNLGGFRGAVHLFNTNGTLMLTVTNPSPGAIDGFGRSVAALGADGIIVGAQGNDVGALNSGAAYLFSAGGTLLQTFSNPTIAANDSFGSVVAGVGSDRVLIGAAGDDTAALNAGAAYLFDTNGVLLTTFTNPVGVSGAFLGGSAAAIGSDRVLIGASSDPTGAPEAGAAYLFDTNGTLLTAFINPAPEDGDAFGSAVAAAGTEHIIVGAPSDDLGIADAGAAYLFTLGAFTPYTPGLIAEDVRLGGIGEESLGDGVVTAAKLDPAIGVWTASGEDVYRTDGGVGIGTTTPLARLDVRGANVSLGNGLIPAAANVGNILNLQVGKNDNGASNGIGFFELNNGFGMKLGYDGLGGGVDNRLVIYDNNDASQFAFENGGNLGVGTNNPAFPIHHSSGAHLTAAGVWNSVSDKAAKEQFEEVDPADVLDRVASLPILQWKYKVEDKGVKHMGPVAQDFHAAFGLGESSTAIGAVDADGVALAAIQGLNEKMEQKDAEMAALRSEMEALKRVVDNLLEKGVAP